MELRTFSTPPSCAGNGFPWFRNRTIMGFNDKNVFTDSCVKDEKKYSSQKCGSFIFCLSFESVPSVPTKKELLSGKVVYSVAPAMGHNKDAHPECNSRVPAITSALANMGLTSEFRGSEIIELQKFRPASADDIASVHERAYVSGLENAMAQASEQGLILIEGSGPTYATSMTFQESLLAAGAGLSVVDAVVMSQSKASFTL